MQVSRLGLYGFLLLLIGFLLTGCGEAENGPDLGSWTLQDDGLSLTEDLRVSETEDFYFGSVTDLAVTSEETIVVADQEANHLKVLARDGSLIDTLGRKGEGPGEFQRLGSVQVARGDSVFAYDTRQYRLTVFAPDSYDVSRTIPIPSEKAFARQVLVAPNHFIGGFGSGLLSYQESDQPPHRTWRIVEDGGTPGDTLTRTRRQQMVMTSGEIYRFWHIPFGRESRVALGPDGRLYHGWTDSLRIAAHGTDGRSEVVASISTPPVPVQERERDSVLQEVNTEALRAKVKSALPDTKPAFTDFVVADDGRLWVRRPPQTTAHTTVPWWILEPATKMIHQVRLPRDVALKVVQNGRAYGTTITDGGAPALVRYYVDANA